MSLTRIVIPSPNFSSRGSAVVRLLVLHTTEGALTIESLGSFFQGNVQASSHCGADNAKANTVGEYVRPRDKAWSVVNFNPVSMNLELCAFTSWNSNEWHNHSVLLENCASWIAEESKRWNIPITRLNASQAQGGGRGVCQHVDLGSSGGGHHDCGPGFPMDQVLERARIIAGQPQPPKPEEIMAISSTVAADGNLHVFVEAQDGSIWYTWQAKNSSSWSGGQPGKRIAGLAPFAPAPGK